LKQIQTNEQAKLDGYISAAACIAACFPAGGAPSMRTFRDWQSKGVIPVLKVGGRTFFKPSQVIAALEKNFLRRAF
jgi:hypothetical protein